MLTICIVHHSLLHNSNITNDSQILTYILYKRFLLSITCQRVCWIDWGNSFVFKVSRSRWCHLNNVILLTDGVDLIFMFGWVFVQVDNGYLFGLKEQMGSHPINCNGHPLWKYELIYSFNEIEIKYLYNWTSYSKDEPFWIARFGRIVSCNCDALRRLPWTIRKVRKLKTWWRFCSKLEIHSETVEHYCCYLRTVYRNIDLGYSNGSSINFLLREYYPERTRNQPNSTSVLFVTKLGNFHLCMKKISKFTVTDLRIT